MMDIIIVALVTNMRAVYLYSLMVRVFVAEKYYSEKRNLCRDATAGGIISHHGLQTTRGASDHTDIEYIY
jgi:hypothetical protein